jgi:hypothetical protein
MVRYLQLLARYLRNITREWLRARRRQCPVCGGRTLAHQMTLGGGVFDCRMCVRCYGLHRLVNVSPERPPEEPVILPF